LDANILNESKGSEFNYSFKIDKHYFNMIQLKSGDFELRIDNRSFSSLQEEEKYKPKKVESNSNSYL